MQLVEKLGRGRDDGGSRKPKKRTPVHTGKV